MIGTYHHLSEAHLHRYTAEFDCRYNTRTMTDGERAAVILKAASVAAWPIGGLIGSPPNFYKVP